MPLVAPRLFEFINNMTRYAIDLILEYMTAGAGSQERNPQEMMWQKNLEL